MSVNNGTRYHRKIQAKAEAEQSKPLENAHAVFDVQVRLLGERKRDMGVAP